MSPSAYLGGMVKNRVDFVGDSFDKGCQEGRGGHAVCVFSELSEGEFAGPVDWPRRGRALPARSGPRRCRYENSPEDMP